MASEMCGHFEGIEPVEPKTEGCEECLATHGHWVHLRMCLVCGHVGCCDSSPGKHATGHFHATAHPVMCSIEPGETWGWCYVDRSLVEELPTQDARGSLDG